MKLDEIMPIEKWVELEKEINRKSGLNAAVFDAAGVRITGFKKWANRLCPAIRETGTIPAHCLATVVDYLEHKVVDIVREYRAGYLNVA